MPTTCSKCDDIISRTDNNQSICCIKCRRIYHTVCVNVKQTEYAAIKNKWNCSECLGTSGEINVAEILANFNELKNDLNTVKCTVVNIENKVEKVVQLGTAVLKNQDDIKQLKKENNLLKKDINRLETISRQNNLVITGVPESPSENLVDIVSTIGIKLNSPVQKERIVKACRFQSKTGKIKPILVVFDSYRVKNDLLWRFKVDKIELKGSDIGLNTNGYIHFGDHLGTCLQKLLHLAKTKLVKSGICKFVWEQNGFVLARKTPTSKIIKLKCDADIDDLARKNA